MEIEEMVISAGASGFQSGWDVDKAAVQFDLNHRRVRFVVPLPTEEEAVKATAHEGRGRKLEPGVWRERETQRRWRCLLLSIKGKLEAATSGISSFDREFFSDIVTDNGQTVFDRMFLKGEGELKLLAAKQPPSSEVT
jgi:hypothetical protein